MTDHPLPTLAELQRLLRDEKLAGAVAESLRSIRDAVTISDAPGVPAEPVRILLQVALDELRNVVEAVDRHHDTKPWPLKYGTPYEAINGARKVREDLLIQAAMWGITVSPQRALSAVPAPPAVVQQGPWRPISEAKKDGNPIWAALHPRIYPDLRPEREDLECWNGRQVPLRHPGIIENGDRTWDLGWNVAAPVGHGGFPDEWIVGWVPFLPPPVKTGGEEP